MNKMYWMLPILLATFVIKAESKKPSRPKLVKRELAQMASQSPEAIALAGFFSCKLVLVAAKDASWMSCLNPFVVESSARRKAFAQFLMSAGEVTRIDDCTPQEIEDTKVFPESTPNFACFEIEQSGKRVRGIAYFRALQQKRLLISVQNIVP